jgi:hypothetical protein
MKQDRRGCVQDASVGGGSHPWGPTSSFSNHGVEPTTEGAEASKS